MEMEKFEYRFGLATGGRDAPHGWKIYSPTRMKNVKLQEVARCWLAPNELNELLY